MLPLKHYLLASLIFTCIPYPLHSTASGIISKQSFIEWCVWETGGPSVRSELYWPMGRVVPRYRGVPRYNLVSLCITMDHYALLCSTRYHYVPLYTTMYHCVPICTAVSHSVALCTDVYCCLLLCTALYHGVTVPKCTTVYHCVIMYRCVLLIVLSSAGYRYAVLCTVLYYCSVEFSTK